MFRLCAAALRCTFPFRAFYAARRNKNVVSRIADFQDSPAKTESPPENAGGNPRAVCNELVRRGLSRRFRCYYILNEPEKYRGGLPDGVRPLKNARLKYYFIMARDSPRRTSSLQTARGFPPASLPRLL